MKKTPVTDQIKNLAEQLGYEDEIFTISPEQKKLLRDRFSFNLLTAGVFFSDENLYITNESTFKNWLYYAGFEYIKDYDMIKKGSTGEFMVVFSINEGRVEEVLETLNEEIKTETEN